jgi:endoribonuclease Dicer
MQSSLNLPIHVANNFDLFQILEALTTERCLERISLERFEVLGDAFLKYIVGRHNFISYEGLDEGQLTSRRSAVVNNSNLYELSIRRNLQVRQCSQ